MHKVKWRRGSGAAAAAAAATAGQTGRRRAFSNIAFRRPWDWARTILRIAFIRRRPLQPPTTCGAEMNCRCSAASLLTPVNNTTNRHVLHSRTTWTFGAAAAADLFPPSYLLLYGLPAYWLALHLWPAGRRRDAQNPKLLARSRTSTSTSDAGAGRKRTTNAHARWCADAVRSRSKSTQTWLCVT